MDNFWINFFANVFSAILLGFLFILYQVHLLKKKLLEITRILDGIFECQKYQDWSQALSEIKMIDIEKQINQIFTQSQSQFLILPNTKLRIWLKHTQKNLNDTIKQFFDKDNTPKDITLKFAWGAGMLKKSEPIGKRLNEISQQIKEKVNNIQWCMDFIPFSN